MGSDGTRELRINAIPRSINEATRDRELFKCQFPTSVASASIEFHGLLVTEFWNAGTAGREPQHDFCFALAAV